MPRSGRKLVSFVILAVCLATSPAESQTRDPFAGNPLAADPFANPPPPKGDPTTIRFRVIDESDQPIIGATVTCSGTLLRTRTNGRGIAEWRTTDQELARAPQRGQRRVTFTVLPPRGTVMPKIHARFSLQELTPDQPLVLRGRPGMRLQGKVVGENDQQPVPGVTLYCTAAGYAHPTRTDYFTRTDETGRWSIVVPHVDTQVVAHAVIPGYDIGHGVMYSESVAAIDDDESVDVPQFAIRQTPVRSVLVIDDHGKPIAGAKVEARYQRWLDEKIVQWERFAPTALTATNGECRLKVENVDPSHAIVSGRHEANGVLLLGRTSFNADHTQPVTLQLHRPTSITGKLTRNGVPAAGVALVIYETLDVEKGDRDWATTRIQAETTTDAEGNYNFAGEHGLRYAIATRERNQKGIQSVLHRTLGVEAGVPYDAPTIELASANEREGRR